MTVSAPALSIIVAAYKTEIYLPQCIESILAQNFKDFELILVNDGSPDYSPELSRGSHKIGTTPDSIVRSVREIFANYQKQDHRIRVIHQENQGLVRARLTGITHARGRYIGFVDSDDWLEPQMYAAFMNVAQEKDADMILGDYRIAWKNQFIEVHQPISPGEYSGKLLVDHMFPTMLFSPGKSFRHVSPAVWNKVYRRELLVENAPKRPQGINNLEDAALVYPCLLDSQTVVVLDQAYYYNYRMTGTSLSMGFKKDYYQQVKNLYHFLHQMNNEKQPSSGVDIGYQIDGNLCYLAIQGVLHSGLGPMQNRTTLYQFVQDPEIQQALASIDLSNFFVTYRILGYAVRKQILPVLKFAAFCYPLALKWFPVYVFLGELIKTWINRLFRRNSPKNNKKTERGTAFLTLNDQESSFHCSHCSSEPDFRK